MYKLFLASGRRVAACIVLSGALGFALAQTDIFRLDRAEAQAVSSRPEHTNEEEHARHEAAIRKAMSGVVDVYFDIAELETGKTPLSGVRFVDIVDVTGKELLRFERGSDQWMIDPDAVVAFHIGSDPNRTNKKK